MQDMRTLLRSSLGKSLGTLSPLDRLAAAWPVACGAALAARGELLSYDDGQLTVRVPDPMWLDQLRSMRAPLTSELARIAAVPLREIHFEGPGQRSPAAAKAGSKRAGRPRDRTSRSPR